MHAVDKLAGAQFLLGARLRIGHGLGRDAAERLRAELTRLGARAELAPHQADGAGGLLALDEVQADGGAGAAPAPFVAVDHDAETRPIARADAPASTAGAAPPPDDDARFRPSRDERAPLELALDRPSPPPRSTAPAPSFADARSSVGARPPVRGEDAPSFADAPGADAVTRPTARAWQEVPGRIAGGALRRNPAARVGVGLVLALGLGWLLAQPYARRAERRMTALRAEADRDRYRPVEEARRRVAALDADADRAAAHGALGTAAIWILAGAAAFAGWWRAT